MRPSQRIAFDARYIYDQYHGIGRYGFRLLEALLGRTTDQPSGRLGDEARDNPTGDRDPESDATWVVFRGPAVDSRFDWDWLMSRPNVEIRDGPWPLYWPQEQLLWPSRLRRADVDLFYSPYFVAPLLTAYPAIITVHDLIFDRYPETMPHAWSRPLYRLLMALSTRRARRIVAVSQATAADLIRIYGVPSQKVTVILEGVDPGLEQPVSVADGRAARRRLGLPRPFVLNVGARRPHKNLARLVRAFAAIADTVDHDLVFVGTADERFPDEARRAAEETGMQDGPDADRRIHFLGWVSETDLRILYHLADLVAVPSLVEGFGLPALEAMAGGTPVLAADASSLPEVVGDAGVLVDPYDEHALAQTLARLLQDPAWRARLSAAGQARAAQFSWRRAAEGVRRAMREAIS